MRTFYSNCMIYAVWLWLPLATRTIVKTLTDRR